MNRSARVASALAVALVAAVLAWVLFVALPAWTRPATPAEDPALARPVQAPQPEPSQRIKARLYYVSADGLRLQAQEREVEFGETTTAQARHLIEAQLAPPEPPLLSAIPPGTTLKELFLTGRGEAYVDLSGELAASHTGGSHDEILTVYTLVAVLTENLPSVVRVQILIDGHEVDTLAGHVDLRRPLSGAAQWIEQPAPPAPAAN
jgi:spore germination protein GerM